MGLFGKQRLSAMVCKQVLALLLTGPICRRGNYRVWLRCTHARWAQQIAACPCRGHLERTTKNGASAPCRICGRAFSKRIGAKAVAQDRGVARSPRSRERPFLYAQTSPSKRGRPFGLRPSVFDLKVPSDFGYWKDRDGEGKSTLMAGFGWRI